MRALKLIASGRFPDDRIPGLHDCDLRHARVCFKKEKKACTFCHAKQVPDKEDMEKNLNDAGKYYKDHDHSLDGYAPKK